VRIELTTEGLWSGCTWSEGSGDAGLCRICEESCLVVLVWSGDVSLVCVMKCGIFCSSGEYRSSRSTNEFDE